jgi:hypothetical protein
VISTIGCDMKLSGPSPPYQDPAGDNFAPPSYPNTTSCDSYLSANNGRYGIQTDVTFIQWGTTSPFVISGVWVLQPDQVLKVGQSVMLLQLAFPGSINQTDLSGTFFLVGPGSVYWSAEVKCGLVRETVSLVTGTPIPATTTTPVPVDSGSIVGIVIGMIIVSLVTILLVVLAVRFCKRRRRVERSFDGMDVELQEDFQAVARAAMRGVIFCFFLLFL